MFYLSGVKSDVLMMPFVDVEAPRFCETKDCVAGNSAARAFAVELLMSELSRRLNFPLVDVKNNCIDDAVCFVNVELSRFRETKNGVQPLQSFPLNYSCHT